MPLTKGVKTLIPVLRKVASVKCLLIKVEPPPTDLSFSFKQISENVAREVNG